MCKWSVQNTMQNLLRGFFHSLNVNVGFKSSKQNNNFACTSLQYCSTIIVLQSNSINTDTEWAIENFCINGVPVLIKSKKSPFTKLSNARKHYKNRSSLYYLIKTVLCITSLMPQS